MQRDTSRPALFHVHALPYVNRSMHEAAVTDTTLPFGQYEITLLKDGFFEPGTEILQHPGGEAPLQAALERLGGEKIRIDVNCFLLRGPDSITLIDSGIGPAWGEAFGHARTALAAAGVSPDQIGQVLLTHLHTDHALGLLDGKSAWLPKAEILIPAAELAYFTDDAARAATAEDRRETFDIAATILAAYEGRVRTIEAGEVPGLPGIEMMPLPGHTPGHSGYVLHGAETLLLWADTVHVQSLQPADPDLSLMFDVDQALARQTRHTALRLAKQHGWKVVGSHLTGFGNVVGDGEAYRFVAS